MNIEEIKAIIAEKIAGQGNQVDIGGALAEVLNAIVEGQPKPIRLTNTIEEGDTLEDVIGVGLTKEEIEAAARGERTGVVIGNQFYQITGAYCDGEEWNISFYKIEYENNGIISGMFGTYVAINGDIVNITKAEI